MRQVARQYDGEGVDLVALAGTVGTDAGADRLGRGFGAVAASYRAAIEGLGRNVAGFGEHASAISLYLSEIASAYESTEDDTTRSIGTVE
jgi:hypothetical protein